MSGIDSDNEEVRNSPLDMPVEICTSLAMQVSSLKLYPLLEQRSISSNKDRRNHPLHYRFCVIMYTNGVGLRPV